MTDLRKAAQAALDDMQCLLDVLREAMGTGGWVPTPLQSSFTEGWVEAGSSMDALRDALAAQAEPVAWIDNSGHPKHLSEVQGVREQQLYGPLRPLFESPPVTHQQADIDAAVAAERERCAALCEMWNTSPGSSLAKEIRGGAEAGRPQQSTDARTCEHGCNGCEECTDDEGEA